MAHVLLTLKVMPESPEVEFDAVQEKAKIMIENFGAEIAKVEIEPIAFGLKALKLTIVMDEELGSTDELEKEISDINDVNSVEVVDVRRTLG